MASNINIKVTENVKKELDDLKLESESYNVLIQRLMRENQELRQDKHTLMKIAMKTPDSIAFPQIAHSTYFALMQVLKDNDLENDDKLNYLKIYLKPSLEINYKEVLSAINSFSNEFEDYKDFLLNLTLWIEKQYDET